MPLAGDRKPMPFLRDTFTRDSTLSQDGSGMAYVSDESGGTQIYVQSFDAEGKWQSQPRWQTPEMAP